MGLYKMPVTEVAFRSERSCCTRLHWTAAGRPKLSSAPDAVRMVMERAVVEAKEDEFKEFVLTRMTSFPWAAGTVCTECDAGPEISRAFRRLVGPLRVFSMSSFQNLPARAPSIRATKGCAKWANPGNVAKLRI